MTHDIIYIYIFCLVFISVLLFARIERCSVSRKRDFYVFVFKEENKEPVEGVEDRVSHGAPHLSDSSRLLSQISFCYFREGIRKHVCKYADLGKSCISRPSVRLDRVACWYRHSPGQLNHFGKSTHLSALNFTWY